MPLMTIIITLVAVGVVLWLANKYVPMDPKIKEVLNIVALIVVVLWLLSIFIPGLFDSVNNIKVGR